MKLLKFFTKEQDTRQEVNTATAEALYSELLKLNKDTLPYRITKANDPLSLIVEWKIVDANWYELFAKAGIKRVFKIYLKLDPEKKEVRALDKDYTVSWTAGVPALSVGGGYFQGQKKEFRLERKFGLKNDFKFGEIYHYRFSTNEMKKPIQALVAKLGWKYKKVIWKL